MADWLRLPSGQALNMDHFAGVRLRGGGDIDLLTTNNATLAMKGDDARAVWAYIERVHVGERP